MLMMLPFEAPTIFEGIHKSYFRMPRVVKDQRGKFENDDLFRQLSHESAVKYTGFKDRPLEERQMKFIANCQEGHTEVSVVQSGNQFTLMFNPTANPAYNNEGCDFDKELGKVHIKAGFILNGVCVLWRGWVDLQRLEGFGCLEFDEYRAYLEDAMLKQQIDKQQTCNNAAATNHQQSPLGRLTNHHSLPGAHLNAAAAAANSLPPVGLNPSCLGPTGPPPTQPPGLPQTPVSLADSAAHYGNAAIAAAAAAAFHQALSVGAPPPPQPLQALGAPLPNSALAAAAAAATSGQAPLLTSSAQHLASYTNGPIQNGLGSIIPSANLTSRNSPPSLQLSLNNGTGRLNTNRTPERDPLQVSNQHRQSSKRAHEEQTQLDDVDVVSDIHGHELDYPDRKIFKSAPITTAHSHHRASRRA